MRFRVVNTKKKQELSVTWEDAREIGVLVEWVSIDAKDASRIGFNRRYPAEVGGMISGMNSKLNKSKAVQGIENAACNLTAVDR